MRSDRESDPKRALVFSETLPGNPVETMAGPLLQPGRSFSNSVTPPISVHHEQIMPHQIGRYVVLRLLGQGGMGVVYSGYDEELDRKVALKVVHQHGHDANTIEQNARILQEAQAMARVSHPNVVQVYEVGKDESSSRIFIAMEFIAGTSLHEFQKTHPSRSVDALYQRLHLYLQAAAGLLAAHRSGLIHRDFKPDNVLLGEDGRVRVVDFGLARALDSKPISEATTSHSDPSNGRLTRTGTLMGTPGYMAPEQILGEEADARSDQFSFCVALYEALKGELPFGGETFEEFAANVLANRLSSPKRGADAVELPIIVEQALRRGLSSDKAARFPSMQELITALEAGLLPDADSERSQRHKRRYRVLLVVAVLIIISARMAGLRSSGSMSMRGPFFGGLASFLTFGIILLALRKAIAKQPALRRQMTFFSIIAVLGTVGRTFGFLANMSFWHYSVLELLSLGALCAGHAAVVGARYLNLTLICVISLVLQFSLPAERAPIHVATYAFLIFFAVYLYPSDARHVQRGRRS